MYKHKPFTMPWKPRVVLYEPTNEDLTTAAGIGTMLDMFVQAPYFRAVRDCLPARISNASYDTEHLALVPICGFWNGYDCLDDLEKFRGDPMMTAKMGELPRAKTIGDYLRDFDEEGLRNLNQAMTQQSLEGRRQIKASEEIVLDIDSTAHVHTGKKIEGLAWNYKGQWCLDSLRVYDELGFCYAMSLRPGNTFSAVGSEVMIRDVLKNFTAEQRKKVTVRADSAFCSQEFIEMCLLMGVKFSITAHGNMNWEEKAKGLVNWRAWVYTKEEMLEAEKLNLELPKVETSFFIYEPGWTENLKFPVIVKRTWGQNAEKNWGWKYYAVITNRGLYPLTTEGILKFHALRGNSENFIKEEKYGYDLKHFPCKSLKANTAYGLLALLAHNFLRTLELMRNPKEPSFAKKIRHKFVTIPGKLISHSGKAIMKIPVTHYKERESMITAWRATLTRPSPDPRLGAMQAL